MDDDTGYVPFAPDLAGEVISPNDMFSDVEENALHWLAAGTQLVLVVDPETRQLHVYRGSGNIELEGDDRFDAGNVVPGWQFTVSELFV